MPPRPRRRVRPAGGGAHRGWVITCVGCTAAEIGRRLPTARQCRQWWDGHLAEHHGIKPIPADSLEWLAEAFRRPYHPHRITHRNTPTHTGETPMSFDDEFTQPGPAGGDPLDLHALLGALLVIEVKELIDHIQTVHTLAGEKTSAVRANVYVLDGPHRGLAKEDALVFPRVLQGQLRGSVGRKVLGRLGRGVATPGRSAPWELAPATEGDQGVARTWASQRTFSQPAAAGNGASAQAPF